MTGDEIRLIGGINPDVLQKRRELNLGPLPDSLANGGPERLQLVLLAEIAAQLADLNAALLLRNLL